MAQFFTWLFSLMLPPPQLLSPIPTEITAVASPSPTSTTSPTVLAYATELPTATSSATPTASPSATPTTTPSATPTNSPKPIITKKPTPTPTATTTPTASPKTTFKQPSGPELDALFTKYSQQYNIDREKLRHIAICESGFNTNAHNLDYAGMFQFSESSWRAYRKLMGQDTDPQLRFSPEESVKTAAWMLSTHRESAWPNCH